jgi:hypothetical protein
VTFHEQRLFFGGSPDNLQSLYGSVSSDYERFSPTGSLSDSADVYTEDDISDDNGITYTIGSNELNAILWARVHRTLVLGTSSSLFLVSASTQQEALTPTNVNVREEDLTGSNTVHPARLSNTIFFAGRSGRTLFGAGYSLDEDSTVAGSL